MSPTQTQVTPDVLALEAERATAEIVDRLREIVGRELKRKGAVVGVSGGIDSSVTAGLCARAFGPDRTLALLMPEADSDPDTLELSRSVADAFDIPTVVEDITPILEATRCYERRDEAGHERSVGGPGVGRAESRPAEAAAVSLREGPSQLHHETGTQETRRGPHALAAALLFND